MWVEGLKITPRAMLSRAVAGTRGSSLILNLPGSEKAAKENLSAVIGALEHAMHMIAPKGTKRSSAFQIFPDMPLRALRKLSAR